MNEPCFEMCCALYMNACDEMSHQEMCFKKQTEQEPMFFSLCIFFLQTTFMYHKENNESEE